MDTPSPHRKARGALSRRTLLAGSAGLVGGGLAASGLLPSTAAAAEPECPAPQPAATGGDWKGLGTRQVPSAYRYKVGDVTVTALCDGMRTFPMPDGFVRNAPRDAVNAALTAAHLPADELSIPFNVLLLDIGGKRILVDTGNGPGQGPGKGGTGLLAGTLQALGIAPEDIDFVVISHFHGDHINGLLNAKGEPAFANAQMRVPQAEWAFWMDEAEASRAPERLKGGFANARKVFKPLLKQVDTYGWNEELAPGLRTVEAAGHTPGHTAFDLTSGKDRLFIQSDLTNIPALFVTHPGWHVMFDMDPEMAARARKRLYDRAASERLLVAGYHFPFPGAAYIDKDGEGYRYVPMLWRPVL